MASDLVRGAAPSAGAGAAEPTPRRRAPLVPARTDVGRGLDLTVEFLSAILLWGGVGWLVDRWLGWTPWGLAVGFMLGFGCGVYLMALRSRPDQRITTARAAAAPTREDDQGGTG